MSAHVPDMNHFGHLFYLVVSWMENGPYHGEVWVLDADHETTRLVLYGNTHETAEFQQKAADLCFSVEDPDQEWRKW